METNTEIIWTKYNGDLKRFILSRINDKDEANDILQEVFIKVHTGIDKVRENEKIRSWVYQITRNAIIDHYRKTKIKVDIDKVELAEEKQVENSTMVNCIEPHISKLPEKYREAITLVEIKGYSQLKLAEALHISYSAAKSRVQRGRELLKSYFESCCNVVADKYGNIISHTEKKDCKLCNC